MSCAGPAVANGIHRLSISKIEKTTRRGLHGDGGGLYLQVARSGARSWLFRYSRRNRTRHVGLGATHTMTLDDAREEARVCRRLLHDGVDPLEHKRARRAAALLEAAKAMTFDECAEAYIVSHETSWKNKKHVEQWRNTLKTYVAPIFGKLPVQAIDTSLVMKVLEAIWSKKPETASRLRGRIEAILSWATVRGFRKGENPARWKGHLDQLLPARSKVRAVKHHKALPYAEIGSFMAALRKRDATAARALEFLILTAGRTTEILHACWNEIDEKNGVWIVPPDRMKGKREHRVPLSTAAISILEKMKVVRQSEFIFPGIKHNKPLSNMSLLQLLERMGYPNLTVHGFRSSFRDWVSEQTHFPSELAEAALAHAISSKTEAAYRRGDLFEKRRALMQAWACTCEEPIGTTADNVLSLRAARNQS